MSAAALRLDHRLAIRRLCTLNAHDFDADARAGPGRSSRRARECFIGRRPWLRQVTEAPRPSGQGRGRRPCACCTASAVQGSTTTRRRLPAGRHRRRRSIDLGAEAGRGLPGFRLDAQVCGCRAPAPATCSTRPAPIRSRRTPPTPGRGLPTAGRAGWADPTTTSRTRRAGRVATTATTASRLRRLRGAGGGAEPGRWSSSSARLGARWPTAQQQQQVTFSSLPAPTRMSRAERLLAIADARNTSNLSIHHLTAEDALTTKRRFLSSDYRDGCARAKRMKLFRRREPSSADPAECRTA